MGKMFLLLMLLVFGKTSLACTITNVGSSIIEWGTIYIGVSDITMQTQIKVNCAKDVEYFIKNQKASYGDGEILRSFSNAEMTVDLFDGISGIGTGADVIYTLYHHWTGSKGYFSRQLALFERVNILFSYNGLTKKAYEIHRMNVSLSCVWVNSNLSVNFGEIKFGEKGYVELNPSLNCGGDFMKAKIYPLTPEYRHSGVEDIVFRYVDRRNNAYVSLDNPYIPKKQNGGSQILSLAIEAEGVNEGNGKVLTQPQSFQFSYPLVVEF